MLKLFRLREDYLAALLLFLITLVISVSLLILLGFLKIENHESIAESFIVEITPNIDDIKKDNVIKLLKSNAIISKASIVFKDKQNAFDHINPSLPVSLKSKLLQSLSIKDIVLFSTSEFNELRVRDEFMNAIESIEGVSSMRNVGTYTSKDGTLPIQLKLLPISIVLLVICILFSFAVIRYELKNKRAEMKMLSFSGVDDNVILSRLRGSVSFAVLKLWIPSVLLLFIAFNLLSENILRHVSYIGIKDIIVALSITLVLLLIALPMYTSQRAKKILKNF